MCVQFSKELFTYFGAVLGLHCCVWAFSSCSEQRLLLWFPGSRVQTQLLWLTGVVAPRLVGSSQTRDQTHVPFIGKWILNLWTTKASPLNLLLISYCVLFFFLSGTPAMLLIDYMGVICVSYTFFLSFCLCA